MNASKSPITKNVPINPKSNTWVSDQPEVLALLIAEMPTEASAPIMTSAITVPMM